ncbi:four-carbon acid sugar kinase family protein [Paralimibaculum aggregatum]|uniref:Four-carbon acid sugar kinase family protein n=1 Tax=Paralimibaculum aggregatum TaxID=3036245 RepID=A0ABQ6LSM1_9RHOB|nr:four-carbon acid sugar kinase family protein [Limibaculum sp. NKW23]GMG85078.1 four-carbon acid sugar kinase family protein [Limibaculum sp. NKW23]
MPDETRAGPAFDTGVIADDLTGGLLVAGFLEAAGIRCPLFTAPEPLFAPPGTPACVIARRIRLAPAEQAVTAFEVAARTLLSHRPRQLYYKYCATFDSTDAGNIGPCAEALLRMTGADRLGFCPAFPAVGITLYQGYMFLRGELLSESPKRHDPVTPMPDPHIPRVLGRQTGHCVGLVPHAVLAEGAAAVRAHVDRLAARGRRFLVFDALDDRDVAVCAEVTAGWPAMTGGDTLAHLAPAARGLGGGQPYRAPPVAGPGAVIAGSCGPATLQQLARFAAHRPLRRLDLVAAAANPGAAVGAALDWAGRHIGAGPVALAISDAPEGVAATQAVLGRDEAARLGERLCAELAAGLFRLGLRRFVVAGGETSGAVAEALGIERLDAPPPGRLGGGLCHAAAPEPMGLFFKAGKMGPPDLFLEALATMETPDG